MMHSQFGQKKQRTGQQSLSEMRQMSRHSSTGTREYFPRHSFYCTPLHISLSTGSVSNAGTGVHHFESGSTAEMAKTGQWEGFSFTPLRVIARERLAVLCAKASLGGLRKSFAERLPMRAGVRQTPCASRAL